MTVTKPPPKFPRFSYHVTQIWPLRCQWKSRGEKDPKSSLTVNSQALLALIFCPSLYPFPPSSCLEADHALRARLPSCEHEGRAR